MNSNKLSVALVTGANGGMGREVSAALLRSGLRVIVSCRPGKKGLDFFNHLCQEYGSHRVDYLDMDLSSEVSVRDAARRLLEKEYRLDVLVNNAGMLGWKPQVNGQGYEMHNMVNCLGPMLFTWLLKPILGRGSRVVNTVSVMLRLGQIPPYFPYPPKKFNRFKQYACSKLGLTLLSLRLAQLWKEDGITVNMADPGIVNTPIIRLHKWIDPLTDVLFRPIIRQAPRGACTSIFLSLDPSVEGITATLFKDCRAVRLPSRVLDDPANDLLWSFFITLLSHGDK
ncbi:MAG TPA: SDR family NAD(P)-dependent oxidoreductase [Bacteroidales bacterium]|nr:MAG: Rhamnolipids biosynthesis 3-oxoacyl-(acyl-carrier-protein) reductase [Bacteroidetes bacterium ADurb.Bin139]HOG25551.1 SDR family NAD(P)-dependent oxidoreductase [Bacteroidales bacterium]HOR12155.1 SDR family NAD(P)-dependent oxidoreductase [Bacteroidales bacterium]HOZ19044.1 SDR family NAD(P)-dependent oxidoreductase [Bacteroidales bacterium]HPB77825.1 SDR family NAD(P)-dependent oxidoreductase [Bacteroidales bacterium]